MTLVLSGTVGLVLSGTEESSYREPKRALTRWILARNPHPYNYANREESFGFFLTPGDAEFWRSAMPSPSRRRAS